MNEYREAPLIANLRAELARNGMRQGDLSRIWHLSEMSVSRRMKGRTPISADELTRAADAFGVTVDDLLVERRLAPTGSP